MARAAAEIERAMLEKAPTLRLGAYRPIKILFGRYRSVPIPEHHLLAN
jgi:hypothetical protein